ncbi:MAG TPA: hypothetical protein VKA67_09390 [Verrucomicrobiae bacterium]|nr:hypothetical protein [Verrucomicrobiae bacterium]
MKRLLKTVLVVIVVIFVVALFLPTLLRHKETIPEITFRLRTVAFALKQYHGNFGTYPTGTWQEASHVLMGENPKQHVFINMARWTNTIGELVDPWGTPFSFSIETNMILRSAGPNRIFGDKDDVVHAEQY